jgi:polygalacturonase
VKVKLYADGAHDDTSALQQMLDERGDVIIPAGNYRVTSTLIIKSDTHVIADKNARLFMCGETARKRGDFLMSTDPDHRNANISVVGGIWDGNNSSEKIRKADLFDVNGYSGVVLNFCNVKKLTLDNLTVINPASYYFRFYKLNGFTISNIVLKSDLQFPNQDGLHFCGDIKNGVIENISAFGEQTNDDLIALNADDYIERVENLDMREGDIENIKINNISADNCHSFIRLLSVTSEIRDITVENVSGGCRNYAINMDAGRYCKTPLFNDYDKPKGVGCIEDVRMSNFNVHWTHATDAKAMVLCETQMSNLEISNVKVDRVRLLENFKKPTLLVTNIYKRVMRSPLGKSIVINNKPDRFEYVGNINCVIFTKE